MYETGARKVIKMNKKGKQYEGFKTSRRRSDALIHFQAQLKSFYNLNYAKLDLIKAELNRWIESGYVIKMDSYVAFEHTRVWSLENQPKKIDADNRRKALQDSLTEVLEIDDKWIYAGNMEKVTCSTKEEEQCIVSFEAMKPKTINDVKKRKG